MGGGVLVRVRRRHARARAVAECPCVGGGGVPVRAVRTPCPYVGGCGPAAGSSQEVRIVSGAAWTLELEWALEFIIDGWMVAICYMDNPTAQ
jgi:hypothetical protein